MPQSETQHIITWDEWDTYEYTDASYADTQARVEALFQANQAPADDEAYRRVWDTIAADFPSFDTWVRANDARLTAQWPQRPLYTTRHP